MQVPSTPTFSSRNKEAKDKADEVALLIQKKEVLEREVRDLTASKDAMIRAIKTAPEVAAAEEKLFRDQITDLEGRVERAKIELKGLQRAIDSGNATLRDQIAAKEALEGQIEALRTDVTAWEGKKAAAEEAGRAAETKYAVIIKEKGDEVASLTVRAAEIRSKNEADELEGRRRMEAVTEQEHRLAVKKDDFAIVVERLRKNYPNITIPLP